MKGKREFPADIPASGDVLSHLSELQVHVAVFAELTHVLYTYFSQFRSMFCYDYVILVNQRYFFSSE